MQITEKTADKILKNFKKGSLKTMGDLDKTLKKEGYGSGWHNESRRHALAAQGIETGSKNVTLMPIPIKKSFIPKPENIIATVRVKVLADEDDDDYEEKEERAMEHEYPEEQYEKLEEWLKKNAKDWELTGNAYSIEAPKEKIEEFKKLAEKVTKRKQDVEWNYWIED